MVMNGAALWEIHSNIRSGRENVVCLEDNKARVVYMFDLLEPIMSKAVRKLGSSHWQNVILKTVADAPAFQTLCTQT